MKNLQRNLYKNRSLSGVNKFEAYHSHIGFVLDWCFIQQLRMPFDFLSRGSP
jgi:hypothetical protein